MHTLEEIQQALLQLTSADRARMARWLTIDIVGHDAIAEPAAAYGAAAPRLLTVDEYLELEETTPEKHEYIAGVVYAMFGVSRAHSLIERNLVIALGNHLRGGPCQTYLSGVKLKLRVGQDDFLYYPDIMVSCGQETANEFHLEQPKLIVEILSPSTERIDRREKALNYRNVTALEEYILVAQTRPQVEIQRRADGWQSTVFTTLDAVAEFRSIDLSLPLSEIYETVTNTQTSPG